MTGRGSMGYGGAIFLLICWLYSVGIAVGQTSPMVHIRNGTLEGSIMMSRKGREFEAFRGIPYAQKPIGELRFEVRFSSILIIMYTKTIVTNPNSMK